MSMETRSTEGHDPDGHEAGLEIIPTITTYSMQPENTSQPEIAIQIPTTKPSKFGARLEEDNDELPKSVIHAPPGISEFTMYSQQPYGGITIFQSDAVASADSQRARDPAPLVTSEKRGKKFSGSPISPSPLTTAIDLTEDWSERATPQAQTMQHLEEIDEESHSSNIEDVPDGTDSEKSSQEVDQASGTFNLTKGHFPDGGAELRALKAALAECWSLCNTLANLSYIYRQKSKFGTGMQEEAWKSCWHLCQELYACQNKDYSYRINPTLDLCRDFCQTLFDARVRDNELADSVLRVSFELNNHMYNTHDRDLPDAFRERTLDFYITLCHRLMKQRSRITETDSLLYACWSLAEMLFSIRQSKNEGRRLGEELLGCTVQACWELCDIFREGWTQRSLRNSDRGTPRPSQAIFTDTIQQTRQPQLYLSNEFSGQRRNPETPTTIFEDTATVSLDEGPVPNVFVLGQGSTHDSRMKCSSNSSGVSAQTRSSEHTSSTNTVTSLSNDPNLLGLRILVLKAATNSGFQRNGSQGLSSFVKSLSSDAFGSLPWQVSLLKNYKKLIAFDPVFRDAGPQVRASAVDISRAVQAMMQSGQPPWLRDLYRLVFGFHVEEAINRKSTALQG
ncbi:hypothetical protein BDV28DRAFT_73898 [Aspergillus coremiiformis]|uniref:DUF7624 domain-containing protein n=1 Tax=Aspergillus coremiiformis TaxID=138285 RepID=A0A5N6YWY2_9EURO|nr:hypothetical protein BDV28DRAFT_73898 [Aspergillus coremiiformis]